MKEDTSIESLEDVEATLKQQLGDKYELAMENCYATLQIKCGMEEAFPSNTFISRYTGSEYRLSRNGFVLRYPPVLKPVPFPSKKKIEKQESFDSNDKTAWFAVGFVAAIAIVFATYLFNT